MLSRFYLVLSAAIIGFYGISAVCGWEFESTRQQAVAAGTRSWFGGHSFGGGRSTGSHFSGFHGGK